VVSRGRVDLALCDLPADVEPSGLRDLVVRAADALRRPVLAAVGPVQPGLAGLAESRTHADAVLRVLRRDGADRTRVVLLDDVRGRVQAAQLCELVAAHPDLAEGPVARLREWDTAHGGALGQSLAAYLDAFGNVNAAARGLHVHPNTVRYRVRRAVEVSGLDLDDPDQRLVATVLLRAEALSETPPPGAAEPAR
jgi:sugar diacid utilization regulator